MRRSRLKSPSALIEHYASGPSQNRRGSRREAQPLPRPFVGSAATDPFIPPPTRERLMAGSVNPRRVYRIEA